MRELTLDRESLDRAVGGIKTKHSIIGREVELRKALICANAQRHILIEGPVGVGKTVLATAIADYLQRPILRVDGDERYTEQKLTGWFDPPIVMQKGYSEESFISGPLTQSMNAGGILFINELNRLNEGVQNVLLPAMDEGKIEIPRIGTVYAKEGFLIIATQNPREFIATSSLSEALSDRFELLPLTYQDEEEERSIVETRTGLHDEHATRIITSIIRETRVHPFVRRGASIRAATSMATIMSFTERDIEDFRNAAYLSLPTRMELREDSKKNVYEVIDEIIDKVVSRTPVSEREKEENSNPEDTTEGKAGEKKTIGI
ncbi:MAG: MoxR family ATPase [Thermoplasmata archaeon]|nr:MoxR family ATPase [Candidatus Sysuiplasma acidicola]